ncbi:MAG: amino acid ABC transporter permease [Streptococcus sp.]|nr:amino acid ABC transporter permease [Streptococcus sp.]
MDFSFLPKYFAYFNDGVVVTLLISACVVFIGTILGVLTALAQNTEITLLKWFVNLYVWIFRGTPMVVQIMISFAFFHFDNLPTIGFDVLSLDFTRLVPGILVIGLNSGAYISEVVRAGIEAIPKGQIEAAYSLGIRPLKTMRYVILPQAFKNILPALGNEFITIVKDSSLLQTIGVMELWSGAQSVASATYLPLTPLLFAAGYYLIVTTILSILLKKLEAKLGTGGNK